MINFGYLNEGNPITGSAEILPEGATEMTPAEQAAFILVNQPISYFQSLAIDIVDTNYKAYCTQGLSYQTYTINNTSKTRDEIDKKLTNVILDIDESYDWTMDEPKEKVVCASKQTCIDFMEAVQCVIASNETKLRDKKTEIENFTKGQVDAYILSPTFPVYDRVI